jgi:hypothetical protein
MKSRGPVLSVILALSVLAGCASTTVTEQTPVVNPGLARPNQIYVYDFIADPAKMPTNSPIRANLSAPSKPLTAKELQTGQQLGTLIATSLVKDIQAMGLPAVHATAASAPQVGDGVIRGSLVSVQPGKAGERFVVGLGVGASELDAVVEGYAMTPEGPQKLGSGTLTSASGKTPGIFAPAAVAIATGNPIGLIVVGGVKGYNELSGRSGLEGRSQAIADAIAEQLKIRFQDRGWIK